MTALLECGAVNLLAELSAVRRLHGAAHIAETTKRGGGRLSALLLLIGNKRTGLNVSGFTGLLDGQFFGGRLAHACCQPEGENQDRKSHPQIVPHDAQSLQEDEKQ